MKKTRPRLSKSKYEAFLAWQKRQEERRVLVIGDTHEPFCLEHYLEHCVRVKEKYQCNIVVHIGDLIDNHFSSYHETDPDGFSAGQELHYAKKKVKRWKEAFPVVTWIKGNHDAIPERKLKTAGLSADMLKPMNELLDVPQWAYTISHEIDNVQYIHGQGGKANTKITKDMMSTVQGHLHTEANITYKVGKNFKVFGMQVGCGINKDSYAMAYGRDFPKPAIGCGVVLENGRLPVIEMMDL